MLRSIQGEQQLGQQETLFADDDTVEDYVSQQTPEVLACRAARHSYPPLKAGQLVFSETDADGCLVRIAWCTCCEKVGRRERWDTVKRRGRRARWFMVDVRPIYRSGYLGKKGFGRMRPRQIQGAVMTMALDGMSKKELQAMTKRNQA